METQFLEDVRADGSSSACSLLMYLLAEGGLRKDRLHQKVDLFSSVFVFEKQSEEFVRS